MRFDKKRLIRKLEQVKNELLTEYGIEYNYSVGIKFIDIKCPYNDGHSLISKWHKHYVRDTEVNEIVAHVLYYYNMRKDYVMYQIYDTIESSTVESRVGEERND